MSELASLAELVTVRDYLRFAVTQFETAGLAYGHGTTTALDDAAFLVLESLRLPIDSIEPWLDARLTRAERSMLAALIEKRVVTRKPSAYLVQSAYIGSHRFYVDERVIVPRSFIGELLGHSDGPLTALMRDPRRVLDLCTGSGAIAIVAAHAYPEAMVTAGDIARDALAVARENIARHKLGARVSAVESDLFGALGGERYDLILCNPPYVTDAAVAAFPAEYKAEPVLAHRGGVDGMGLVRRVLEEASAHLTDDGLLVVEVGQGRAVLESDYPDLPFLWLDTETSSGEVFALDAEALQNSGTTRGKAKARSRRTPVARRP